MYGIPHEYNRIVKYEIRSNIQSIINEITSFIGEQNYEDFGCKGDGVLGRDGCFYALTVDAGILKIVTANNSHCFIRTSDFSDFGWNDAILGIDGCIYWPPNTACRILKYDPNSNLISLIGDDFGFDTCKWCEGCLASDGVIYCLPLGHNRILSIGRVYIVPSSLKKSIEEHPEKLGYIFQPSDDNPYETNFERADETRSYKKYLKMVPLCLQQIKCVRYQISIRS